MQRKRSEKAREKKASLGKEFPILGFRLEINPDSVKDVSDSTIANSCTQVQTSKRALKGSFDCVHPKNLPSSLMVG